MAIRQDFTIDKGGKFYIELDIVDENNVPVDLTGKTMECFIKESNETTTNLFHLTEANNGISVLDDANGKIALFISNTDTGTITADYGFYYLMKRDTAFPLLDTERTMEGRIKFTKGVVVT